MSEKHLNETPTTSTLHPVQCCQVDEKLLEFETDVNETIKLLYADIEERVNIMLNDFAESECNKLSQKMNSFELKLKDVETTLTSVSFIVGEGHERLPQQIGSTGKNGDQNNTFVNDAVDELREQVFT